MKKILFLLLPIFSYGQGRVVFNGVTAPYNTGAIGSTSGNYSAGRLYLIFTGQSNAGGSPATCAPTGTGQTWTEIGTAGGQLNQSGNRRIQVFRFAPASLNTNQTNFNYTGTQDGGFVFICEVLGSVVTGTNGADAIVQTATASANGADPSITMSALKGGNSVIAMFINETNPGAGTPESGWTQTANGGYATPDTGGYSLFGINWATDNTPSFTSASSNWGGIALEIQSAARRITISN